MSIKALARERLALIRGGETRDETPMKQVKQAADLFHDGDACSTPMKHGNPQETAENGVCFTVSPSRARNSETAPLSPSVRAGLDRLRQMPTPRIRRPSVWPEIVSDAIRLAEQGWASSALGLGWEPIHLWGVSFAHGGIADLEGVAVWLDGGVPMFSADYCNVRVGPGRFRCMKRRPMDGAIYLWEIGR